MYIFLMCRLPVPAAPPVISERRGVMRVRFRSIIPLIISIMVVFSASCQEDTGRESPVWGVWGISERLDLKRLEEMEEEIDALIGTAPCEGGSDCRYIAFGAKPCGGPWKYKVYSASGVDTDLLEDLVEEYRELNVMVNRLHGLMSDCSIPPVPIATCHKGRCIDVYEYLHGSECAWVEIDPVQCMGNPWEIDWIENGGDPALYPRDLAERFEIIREYYEGLGVEIIDGSAWWTMPVTCRACSCPEGYTVYVRIWVEDVEYMLDGGWRISDMEQEVD